MTGSTALSLLSSAGIDAEDLGGGYYQAKLSPGIIIRFHISQPITGPARDELLRFSPLGRAME